MRVCTIVGARPQFVKAAVVSRAVRECDEEVLVHTGQHYDEELSDVFFDELDIPEPDFHLGVGSASHGRQTADMIAGIEEIVEDVDPDVLLLYGDTNSTLAGAIVGSKCDVAVTHVEAGLRSFNREMPEEINRVLTDHASDHCFAPSERAVEQLASEGITTGVHFTGDVMYDAVLEANERATDRSDILGSLGVDPGAYVLATVHRAGNTDDAEALGSIVEGLASTSRPVIFPAHPRTVSKLRDYGLWERTNDALTVVDPVGYLDFVRLLGAAERVATDSGGVQKEAFFLDTPCVTLREETEWTETVDCGWNELVGSDAERINEAIEREWELTDKPQPYGDGMAADRIVEVLRSRYADAPERASVSESGRTVRGDGKPRSSSRVE